ncbi:MAG: hypothetical protein FJ125_07270, partial [Deltaproteobacteria bacterium]|nr:hypothetical protein [Deltaproteobacteria bacterium]
MDHCEPGCNNPSDCLRGWDCQQVTASLQRCLKKCARRSDCPEDHSCEDQHCVAEVALCAACDDDTDCGNALAKCLNGPGGRFCAKDCSLRGDCPAGYRCETQERGVEQCLPATGDCSTICPLHPCAAGTVCNRASGRCHPTLGPCDPCADHAECGENARCLLFGENKHCLLACPGGSSDCPKGFRCNDAEDRAYCVPLTGTCDRCSGTVCSPLAPYCNPEDGVCLECLSSRHCSQDELCGETSSFCIAGGPSCGRPGDETCVAPTPFCFEHRCVECLSSGDCPPPPQGAALVCYRFRCLGDDFCQRVLCPSGTSCDREARRCIETGTCQDDPDCPGRRCDEVRGICYNADG